MALLDFLKRSRVPVQPQKPAAVVALPTAAQSPPKGESPEDILDNGWTFRPDSTGVDGQARNYHHVTIQSIAAIAAARALMSIADDVEAIKKHITRLQLVRPAMEAPPSVDAVDPHASSTGTPTPRDGTS